MSPAPSAALYTQLVGDPQAERRVVLLHGLFGRGKNLTRVAQGLQPEAQSLLVDLPNHGRSSWTEAFDYVGMAHQVAAELQHQFAANGPVDVVGHSMGGKVAMVLALLHPELVRRLAVLDIAPIDSGAERGNFAHLLDSLAALDLTTLTRRAEADAALTQSIPDPGVRGFLLQNLRSAADGGFEWEPNLSLLRASLPQVMGFPDLEGRSFDGPVLWVKGADSDYIQDQDAPIMRSLFPRTRKVTIRGAGHWVHSQQPEAVIEALRLFLL